MSSSSLNNQSDYLLSFATGYQWEQISVFVSSFRKHNKNAHIIIYTDNPSIELQTRSKEYGFTIICLSSKNTKSSLWLKIASRRGLVLLKSISSVLPSFLTAILSPTILRYLGPGIVKPNQVRYAFYEKTVSTLPSNAKIIVSDCRDVYFQRDPFDGTFSRNLNVYLEHDGTIGAGSPASRATDTRRFYTPKGLEAIGSNAYWIQKAYGGQVLDQLYLNEISCSGVTSGRKSVMTKYLRKMCAETLKCLTISTEIHGIDQGIHNFLLYKSSFGLGKCNLHPNSTSAVFTVHGTPDCDINIDSSNRLVNRNGSIPSIIHQYDRNLRTAHLASQ